jgi:Zn-finger protein
MKKINYSKKIISYNIFFCIVFGLFLFIYPNLIVNAESLPPSLTVSSPANNSYLDTNNVYFSGVVSDDLTASTDLILNVYFGHDSLGIPIPINADGSWSYSKQFLEGIHEATFEIMDADTNFQTESITFTVDTSRPTIMDLKIIPPGITDSSLYLPVEDMTQIPVDSKIFVAIKDVSPLNFDKILSVVEVGGSPGVPVELVEDIPRFNVIDGTWEFILSPQVSLANNTSYLVYINPFISDSIGKFIFPKFFKFSTVSTEDTESTHGNYLANTQSCANCHSTHVATRKGLEGGKYGSLSTTNYCMACHDGTTSAPIIGDFKSHKHKQMGEKTDTCTSCHNPHLTWSKENPNRLKDHYVYNHINPSIGYIDSDIQLCESCHEQDARIVKNDSHYRLLTYKKAVTTTGSSEDFTLCFQCHDGNKGSNIKQFYSTPEINTNSGHNIIAADGSPLNGQMPCADCHVTHGTDNIKGLKTKLGHIQREDAYITTNTEWTAYDERQFCLKCHNNTMEMYGKKATLFAKDKNGMDIPEHNPAAEPACSSCHGTGSDFVEQSRSAAHAPMVPTQTTTSQ